MDFLDRMNPAFRGAPTAGSTLRSDRHGITRFFYTFYPVDLVFLILDFPLNLNFSAHRGLV